MDINNNAWTENEANIVNYLYGKLSKEEKDAFEKQLKHDPILREHFTQVKDLITVLKEPELVRAEQQLLELRNARIATLDTELNFAQKWWYKQSHSSKVLLFYTLMLLIIASASYGLFISFTLKASSIYDNYLQPHPASITDENVTEKLIIDANTAYKEQKWEIALSLFSELYERNSTYAFYHVITKLFLDKENGTPNTDQRIRELDKLYDELETEIAERDNFEYGIQLQYWISFYKSLLFFNSGEKNKAIAVLENLSKQPNLPSEIQTNIEIIQTKIDNSLYVY